MESLARTPFIFESKNCFFILHPSDIVYLDCCYVCQSEWLLNAMTVIKSGTKCNPQVEVALEIASDQTVPDKWDL